MGYYVITLFAVTVFHEWGHAAAARAEGIQVLEYGLVFCGPVPMAYVNLPTRDLETAPIGAKLRVMTAGVWHNIVLAVAAFLLLTTLPWISLPLYKVGGYVCNIFFTNQPSNKAYVIYRLGTVW